MLSYIHPIKEYLCIWIRMLLEGGRRKLWRLTEIDKIIFALIFFFISKLPEEKPQRKSTNSKNYEHKLFYWIQMQHVRRISREDLLLETLHWYNTKCIFKWDPKTTSLTEILWSSCKWGKKSINSISSYFQNSFNKHRLCLSKKKK